MAKNLTSQMAKGLGSLIQPTTAAPTTEPIQNAQTAQNGNDATAPQKKPRVNRKETPVITPSAIEGMAAVGVKKNTRGAGAKVQVRPHTDTVTDGLQSGYTRATIIARAEYIDKMKEISYRRRTTLKQCIDEALALYIDAYEDENGAISL